MPVPLLLCVLGTALAAVVGGAAILEYWSQILDWLSAFITKLKNAFAAASRFIKHAAIVVAAKCKEAYTKIMHKLYYKENRNWIEETTTRTIPESEVPPQILAKIQNTNDKEGIAEDVTDEMEKELQMTI